MGELHQIERVRGGWKPACCLLLLAPIAGELITSSAPPFVFFIPWVFVLFALLYGCGAILVRELAVRWGSGWTGILLLGAAYGILEEGLGAKSFFDPHWRALGPLGTHGRWLGVNWVWTLGLILFHSGFCMGWSILAASLPFPQHRNSPWLSRKALTGVGIAYGFVLLLFFQKGNENGYQAPASYYWASVAAAALLALAAALRPRRMAPRLFSEVPASWLGWLGFSSIIVFILTLYALPGTGVPAWVTTSALVGLAVTIGLLLRSWSGAGSNAFTVWQEFSLAAGAIGAFAIQAPFQEWNPARGSSARGMTFVGIACCLYIFWLRGVALREVSSAMEKEPCVS